MIYYTSLATGIRIGQSGVAQCIRNVRYKTNLEKTTSICYHLNVVKNTAHEIGQKVLKTLICYCGSGVEQLTRNEQVVGSIPTSSSKKTDLFLNRWVCLFLCLKVIFTKRNATQP